MHFLLRDLMNDTSLVKEEVEKKLKEDKSQAPGGIQTQGLKSFAP